ADVGLRAEVEHIRAVGGCVAELADEVVDGGAVGEVGEVNLHAVAQVPDVVQGAARGGAHEGVDAGVEVNERLGQVRAHEAVGAGDEDGPAAEDVNELAAQGGQRVVGPRRVVVRHVHSGRMPARGD